MPFISSVKLGSLICDILEVGPFLLLLELFLSCRLVLCLLLLLFEKVLDLFLLDLFDLLDLLDLLDLFDLLEMRDLRDLFDRLDLILLCDMGVDDDPGVSDGGGGGSGTDEDDSVDGDNTELMNPNPKKECIGFNFVGDGDADGDGDDNSPAPFSTTPVGVVVASNPISPPPVVVTTSSIPSFVLDVSFPILYSFTADPLTCD